MRDLRLGGFLLMWHNRLDRTSRLKQILQVLLTLEVGVTADVLLVDEDVGDGALAWEFGKSALDSSPLLCSKVILAVDFFKRDINMYQKYKPIIANPTLLVGRIQEATQKIKIEKTHHPDPAPEQCTSRSSRQAASWKSHSKGSMTWRKRRRRCR